MTFVKTTAIACRQYLAFLLGFWCYAIPIVFNCEYLLSVSRLASPPSHLPTLLQPFSSSSSSFSPHSLKPHSLRKASSMVRQSPKLRYRPNTVNVVTNPPVRLMVDIILLVHYMQVRETFHSFLQLPSPSRYRKKEDWLDGWSRYTTVPCTPCHSIIYNI